MAKKFTDANKWRTKWFRTLSNQAKLVWIYLCDECDGAGVLKPDYELATFQVGFEFGPVDLKNWFGKKIHFINEDTILIVPYFEFQYGSSKDTWSAKIKARETLESLGFTILNNQVLISQESHSPPTVGTQENTLLIKGIVIGKGKVKEEVPNFRKEAERYLQAVRLYSSDHQAEAFLGESRKDCLAYIGGIPFVRKLKQEDSWDVKRLADLIKDAWETINQKESA
ncbi:MAG: hypothetical protein OM95_07090 [Bdellovibrio sp. ArHS]|uniref:hypothetical protein n=1 Tax=Bdellovibrio sp. ArHS TaxID=1569284 RepID=UPI0005823A9B|nr:hypothetical protein [Bdellovibrio sp. ArHS]KHD88874.1 MAG: hypothetical protein OM95_07090 [Bdellovibrio sp. ArHS]